VVRAPLSSRAFRGPRLRSRPAQTPRRQQPQAPSPLAWETVEDSGWWGLSSRARRNLHRFRAGTTAGRGIRSQLSPCPRYSCCRKTAGVEPQGAAHRRMKTIADRYLPFPRILHPWPEKRFLVTIQGGSPVS
jgi:hypothetical protein